jgi:hypothetical protein
MLGASALVPTAAAAFGVLRRRRILRAPLVVSIALDRTSLDTARERATAAGLANTRFHLADIATFRDAEPC